ncbi:MAG: hypothetical protein KF765_12425 [Parvibaculaceae bacterium]|nr:hypothetical protein [Parvibaculaceae bacterium]
MEIDIRAERVSRILGAWADRRIRPHCAPSSEPLDFSQEPAATRLLLDLAGDPEADLSAVPGAVLRIVWARVLFGAGVAKMMPDTVMLKAPFGISDDELLPHLIRDVLAQTTLPTEWRREQWRRLQ